MIHSPQPLKESETRYTEDDIGADTADELAQVTRGALRKLLVFLVAGAGVFIVLQFTPVGRQLQDWDTLAQLLQTGKLSARLYFLAITTFLVAAGAPRLLLSALGGFVFGFWEGFLWSILGSLIGSFLTFQIARWGGREWLFEYLRNKRFFGRIVRAKPTVASVTLIRMLPVAGAIINVGLALGQVGNRTFLIGSLAGFLPQAAVAAIVGSGLAHDSPWIGAFQIGLAGVLLIVSLYLASRSRRGEDKSK